VIEVREAKLTISSRRVFKCAISFFKVVCPLNQNEQTNQKHCVTDVIMSQGVEASLERGSVNSASASSPSAADMRFREKHPTL